MQNISLNYLPLNQVGKSKAIEDVDTVATAKFIVEQVIHCHGCSQVILTDNRTNFTTHIILRLNKQIST